MTGLSQPRNLSSGLVRQRGRSACRDHAGGGCARYARHFLGDNANGFGQGHEALAPGHPAYGIQMFNQRIATGKRLKSGIVPAGSWLSASLFSGCSG